MVTEIPYADVPRTVYRRGFTLTFPPGIAQDLFFRVETDASFILEKFDCVWDYIEEVQRGPLPRGILSIRALNEPGTYLMVTRAKKEIGAEAVLAYVESLFDPEAL